MVWGRGLLNPPPPPPFTREPKLPTGALKYAPQGTRGTFAFNSNKRPCLAPGIIIWSAILLQEIRLVLKCSLNCDAVCGRYAVLSWFIDVCYKVSDVDGARGVSETCAVIVRVVCLFQGRFNTILSSVSYWRFYLSLDREKSLDSPMDREN